MQNIVGFRKKPKIKKRWGRNITLHAMDEMDSLPAAWIFYFHGHLARVSCPVLLRSISPVPEFSGYCLVEYRLLNMRTWSQSCSAAYTLWNIRNWLVNTRLRVVPHFSSGVVERAKRERAWKSPDARQSPPRVAFPRVGWFSRARVSFALLSLRKNEGLLIVYVDSGNKPRGYSL